MQSKSAKVLDNEKKNNDYSWLVSLLTFVSV